MNLIAGVNSVVRFLDIGRMDIGRGDNLRFNEAKNIVGGAWPDLELIPHGKVTTKKQYDYVLYYGQHTCIAVDDRYIKPFEEECGKYLHLGDWFGGASFYFYFSDHPEGVYESAIRNKNGVIVGYKDYYEDFTYGRCGKIEFE